MSENLEKSEEEKETDSNVVKERLDSDEYEKVIAELKAEISEIKETLSWQEMFLPDLESINKIKSIIADNKQKEKEMLDLQEKVRVLESGFNPYIDQLKAKVAEYQIRIIRLTKQLEERARISENEQDLLEFGRLMKSKLGKGKRESKKIDNTLIKEMYLSGKKPAEIFREIEKKDIKCSLNTVLNRIKRMREKGELE